MEDFYDNQQSRRLASHKSLNEKAGFCTLRRVHPSGVQDLQRIRYKPGRGRAVNASLFRTTFDAFPLRYVVMGDVIEEGRSHSARFHLQRNFTPFMGYRPKIASIQMRSIISGAVKYGSSRTLDETPPTGIFP